MKHSMLLIRPPSVSVCSSTEEVTTSSLELAPSLRPLAHPFQRASSSTSQWTTMEGLTFAVNKKHQPERTAPRPSWRRDGTDSSFNRRSLQGSEKNRKRGTTHPNQIVDMPSSSVRRAKHTHAEAHAAPSQHQTEKHAGIGRDSVVGFFHRGTPTSTCPPEATSSDTAGTPRARCVIEYLRATNDGHSNINRLAADNMHVTT